MTALAIPSDAEILAAVEGFCLSANIAHSTFGMEAIGDPKLITNMRGGRSMTIRTARRVLDYMAKQAAHLELKQSLIASLEG